MYKFSKDAGCLEEVKTMSFSVGANVMRKEAKDKVTGFAKYTRDLDDAPMLYAHLLCSKHAHAKIISIDVLKAKKMPGVRKIITGNDYHLLCGEILKDRPPLAKNKVRYFGEPIAIIIADDEQTAKGAADRINVKYKPLPAVISIKEAIKPKPVIIHENLVNYKKQIQDLWPIENSNIFHHSKVRKGNVKTAQEQSDVIIESDFKMPQTDHAAMETRVSRCKITPSGKVIITTASQAPFAVKEMISECFDIPEGNVIVKTPLVGGSFGGKASVNLEFLAVMASKAVNGKCVNLSNTREQDLVASPCHHETEAKIKIGARNDGSITFAEMTFYINAGAYCDVSPRISKAIVSDCSGPYNIQNIKCDCFAVYTNLPYTTSFRGFGHISTTFCIERMIDKLAEKLSIDPIKIRLINAIKEGDITPTGSKVTLSNTGDLKKCLQKLENIITKNENSNITQNSLNKNVFEKSFKKIKILLTNEKNEGLNNNLVRATGVACFYKTSSTATNASASAVLSFNSDGSINLDYGSVEIGPGMRTIAAQILAEKMKMSIDRIHVKMDVNTQTTPYYWKTVASMTTYMVGRAVLKAAEDAIGQLLDLGSVILRCPKEDLEVAYEMVFLKENPEVYVKFKDMVMGYKYSNQNAVGGPIIARGSFIMNNLTLPDKETGQGELGKSWTLGVQAVEIEYDKTQCSYRILKAITVVDVGKVIHPKLAKGVIMGGMCMGLGVGASEAHVHKQNGTIGTTSFRTYKSLKYGEVPEYIVEFVESPQISTPFGSRGIGEHGIIGMPAALANAVSKATQIDVTETPITPEYIWRRKFKNDSV